MVNRNIFDDVLIHGSVDSTVSKIKKPVEKTLALEGNVDILSVGTGINDAKLSVDGIDIRPYTQGTIGTVTQITSISTAVTLNTKNGVITTVSMTHNPNDKITFTVNNSIILPADIVIMTCIYGGQSLITAVVGTVGTGSFTVHIQNVGGQILNALCKVQYSIVTAAN